MQSTHGSQPCWKKVLLRCGPNSDDQRPSCPRVVTVSQTDLPSLSWPPKCTLLKCPELKMPFNSLPQSSINVGVLEWHRAWVRPKPGGKRCFQMCHELLSLPSKLGASTATEEASYEDWGGPVTAAADARCEVFSIYRLLSQPRRIACSNTVMATAWSYHTPLLSRRSRSSSSCNLRRDKHSTTCTCALV